MSSISLWLTLSLTVAADPLPSPREIAAARTDVWAEAAIRQPGGPSYEFFRDLLPPLRYANTAFRHYPIVLSAPGAAVKARWISDGSGVNLRADKKPMWKEAGTPIRFLVGEPAEAFGADPKRREEPKYESGYLPIVRIAYKSGAGTIEQEAFAPVRELFAKCGMTFIRFTSRGPATSVTAKIESDGPLTAANGAVRDAQGKALVLLDEFWVWDPAKKELHAETSANRPAILGIATQPLALRQPTLNAASYDAERRACIETWESLLKRGMSLDIPEPIVQNAWRSLIIANEMIAVGDRMHYSAGNAYDHLYEGECGDAVRALLLFGQTADARRMVGPLLDFNRAATRCHVAGHKLQLLAHYYWITRDAEYVRSKEAVWGPVVDFILTSRNKENGLMPPDRYAGDIDRAVFSLSSNSNCWRGLRDMASVLHDMGERDRAAKLTEAANKFRTDILAAVAKSERKEATPPFIPIALFDDEPAHDPLTATRTGSYYCLMAPYVLGSNIFAGSERESWLIDYLRQHGGIAMGMIRSMPAQGEFAGQPGVNVLYGLRYMQTLLRRGDREHALAGFYGHLAQAMTRDTFIGGEGSRFLHGDAHGRSFYLPPNSASNAMFLQTLRYLLIQDWEDEAGRPQELRLLDAVPGRWLADGAALKFENAPSRFGPIALRCESRLNRGEVLVTIEAPPRAPAKWTLRLPLPSGWTATAATIDGQPLAIGAEGVMDLTGRNGRFEVRVVVRKK